MNILRKVNDIPLNYKFMLIYLLCVLLPIITINVLFFEQVSRNIQVREENNLQISMDRSAKEVMGVLLGGITLSHSLSTDRVLYENLDKTYKDTVDYYETYDGILRYKMKPFLSAYPYMESIVVYTDNDTIESGGNYAVLNKYSIEEEWYRQIKANPQNVTVLTYKAPSPMNPKLMKEYFSIIRILNEFSIYNQYPKYLKIDINIDKLREVLNSEKPYLTLDLLQADGRSAFSMPNTVNKQQIVFEKSMGEASFFKGWKLVGIADKDHIAAALRESKSFIWMLAIISTILPTTLIFVILRSYNYRIKRLSRHMEKVKNEKFDLITLQEGKDEIGLLIQNFNLMASKINSLINDVYKLEIQKKDLQLEQVRAELNLLQSQMNPHFLFNTLNALLVVSAQNQYTGITEVIRNLSLILRRMLSWTDDLVQLQEELQFTEMYLKIEKFRFSDRFDYEFQIDESAMPYKVPKMCIQPLVENACKHGLQAVKGLRRIQISVELIEQYLMIRVEDNGIGMNAEQLNAIMQQVHHTRDAGVNIGLRNVYQRLKLYYDDRVDFRIESQPGSGTKVWYKIPIKQLNLEAGDEHVQSNLG